MAPEHQLTINRAQRLQPRGRHAALVGVEETIRARSSQSMPELRTVPAPSVRLALTSVAPAGSDSPPTIENVGTVVSPSSPCRGHALAHDESATNRENESGVTFRNAHE